jgi:hypothetical protein
MVALPSTTSIDPIAENLHMKVLAARVFLVIVVLLLCATISSTQIVDSTPTLATKPMDGVFYNILAHAGGSVTTSLDIQPATVTGFMNFTQRPEDSLVLYGAGIFNGIRSTSTVTGSLISHDNDPGCTFDDGAIATITGTVALTDTVFYGEYTTKNANGSTFDPSKNGGVFEVWIADYQPIMRSYAGRFLNTMVNRGGRMIMDLAIGQQIVYGYVNATNDAGQSPLCGAGFFTGYMKPDGTLEVSYVSEDNDPGCGFDHGLRNILQIAFAPDQRTLTGTYTVGLSGGTFTVTRIQKVYLPLGRK